jgi:hypothetical protein
VRKPIPDNTRLIATITQTTGLKFSILEHEEQAAVSAGIINSARRKSILLIEGP